jgi:dipeptidase
MCDSLVARGARTVDGATLFAKNSDRRGRESQPFLQFPASFHPRQARVRCTHIEIDQGAETYRVMGHSPAWCWGFEQGVNEFGVAIGNHATFSREPLEEKPGLIGMDLVRLGLERGRDAREALEVIASLVETHGQGGSAFGIEGDGGYQNSFAIADSQSAWVLETTARGWAARSVEGASLTNALTLGDDWDFGSRDLERNATQQGFWVRGGRLDFKAAYARDDAPAFLTDRRVEAAEHCLAGSPLSVPCLKRWLCDHGGQTEPPDASLEPADPGRYSVCMHADPISTTTASMVARLPETTRSKAWPVWISFATPCTGLFIPVYLDGVLPAELASAGGSSCARPGGGSAGPESVWESMRVLQERAAVDFARSLPILSAEWAKVSDEIESDRRRVEADLSSFEDEETRFEGARELTDFMARTTARVLETSQRLATSI